MVDGYERCALAASGQVCLAEVGHDRSSQRTRIAELDRRPPVGSMKNRLSVKADQIDRTPVFPSAHDFGSRDMHIQDRRLRLGKTVGPTDVAVHPHGVLRGGDQDAALLGREG